MSTHLLDTASISPGSRYVHEKQQLLLTAVIEELASLRFSVMLTARWEASAGNDLERRDELRDELADLHRQYSGKLDDIAMTFGIQTAMDAKEEVERKVVIPLGMNLLLDPREDIDFEQ